MRPAVAGSGRQNLDKKRSLNNDNFGLVALREKPMPRGNALPALAGFWFPLIVLGSNVYHQVTGHWLNVPFWPSFALFSGMGFFLAWLGYVMQSDAPPRPAVA